MRKAAPVFALRNGTPTTIPIADIVIGPRIRALDQETVRVLAESMKALDLKTPITVRRTAEGYELIAGWHRLEAACLLGWQEISAIIVVGSEREARLWEIDENLCRSELTPLERAEHIKERVRLVGEKVAQVGPPSGLQPQEQGIRKTARDLDVSRSQVQRDLKIASITPEAKEAAREVGMDKNQSKLLAVAAQPPGQQVGKVVELAKQRTRRTPEEIAAARREQAQRQADKQASQDSERRAQAERDAALTSMAVLVLELPEPSVRNFVEKAEAAPLARISELVSAMRALRPEQFEGEHEYE